MAVWLIPVLTAVAGAVLSGVVTFLSTRSKLAFDYDADLRKRRIEAYLVLWSHLGPLAKYAGARLGEDDLGVLAEKLKDWYFGTGGLFLSVKTRNDYFAVQDLLSAITTKGWGWSAESRESLTPAAHELLRLAGSSLRASLTFDVGTRARPKVPGKAPPANRRIAGIYDKQPDDKHRIEVRLLPRLLGGGWRNPVIRIDTGKGFRAVEVLTWDSAVNTARVRVPGVGDRIFILGDDQLVEGPVLPVGVEEPAVLWHKDHSA